MASAFFPPFSSSLRTMRVTELQPHRWRLDLMELTMKDVCRSERGHVDASGLLSWLTEEW